ncbi:hypothetical protein TNCV_3712501 [Trichonephila clavipes]|nr:hypothetical protein TNCV_3712501 [Trichonephila clavipes]
MQDKNNSPRQHERSSSTQQEKTTQLSSRNETTQLGRRKQLNSALPSTAYNRLNRLYSRIRRKQFNSPPSTRKSKPMQDKNNSPRQHERSNSTQQEKTTQLSSRNETTQLGRRKQLNSALPSTAYNRLNRLYSRIRFFYLLTVF